jgi:hypothetical protein
MQIVELFGSIAGFDENPPYAVFEFDPETDVHEGDVAQKALERLVPRYKRHPKQALTTKRLGARLHNEETTQHHKRPEGLGLHLYAREATVLGKALKLFVADTLQDTRAAALSPEEYGVRILETIAANSMLEVLGQEFPRRPQPGLAHDPAAEHLFAVI